MLIMEIMVKQHMTIVNLLMLELMQLRLPQVLQMEILQLMELKLQFILTQVQELTHMEQQNLM